MLIGGGLMTGALLAGNTNLITVTLPYAVTAGATTLPSGHYTISAMDMGGGDDMLVIRTENGHVAATLQARRNFRSSPTEKSQVILSKDGDNWNLDKVFVEGDGVSYEIVK